MSKASLREFREYYETTALKWVTKSFNVLRTCFPRPKDRPSPLQCRGVVYKVGCADCNFVYYGQTDRALETRLKEHKRAVRVGDNNSKVAQHANQFGHSIDFNHATIGSELHASPHIHIWIGHTHIWIYMDKTIWENALYGVG